MSESILDKIGADTPSSTRDEVLGPDFVNEEGKLIGREIVSTDLRGLWIVLGNGVVVEPDDTVSKFDNAILIFEIQADGTYAMNTGYSTETNGQITISERFVGRLYNVSGNMYTFVNGTPEQDGYGQFLQVAAFSPDRNTGCGYLMDWNSAGTAIGQTFLEMSYLYKLSNNPNSEVQDNFKALADQWL